MLSGRTLTAVHDPNPTRAVPTRCWSCASAGVTANEFDADDHSGAPAERRKPVWTSKRSAPATRSRGTERPPALVVWTSHSVTARPETTARPARRSSTCARRLRRREAGRHGGRHRQEQGEERSGPDPGPQEDAAGGGSCPAGRQRFVHPDARKDREHEIEGDEGAFQRTRRRPGTASRTCTTGGRDDRDARGADDHQAHDDRVAP